MTAEQIIGYVNSRLNCGVECPVRGQRTEGLKLSPAGEKFIIDRYTKSEDQGGYSNWWKETDSLVKE
jgi:hypothetical protein